MRQDINNGADTMQQRRYLPICNENGEFVERPDYLLLATFAEPTLEGMLHCWEAMKNEDKYYPGQTSEMSDFGASILKNRLNTKGRRTERTKASLVIAPSIYIAKMTNKPPSINKSYELASIDWHNQTNTGTPQSLRRSIQKSFSKYRDTSHILAVSLFYDKLISDVEGDIDALTRYLGVARAIEGFIDSNIASDSFRWNPFRIPEHIPAITRLEFPPPPPDLLAKIGL